MKGGFLSHRSNDTPWMDEISLITVVTTRDNAGYNVDTETSRTVDCNFYDGVSRGEFYESMKAGMRASATAEVWPEDYLKETLVEFDGVRYEVIRHYPSGYGTIYLILKEVVR